MFSAGQTTEDTTQGHVMAELWGVWDTQGMTALPQPSLSLHPSQGVSLGDTVTLRCHLPRMAAWVQLWFNGTLRFDKEKDKEQDAAEFSFAVTNLEDAGTYQCRYQVSEPLWTSNQSDPVELLVTAFPTRPRPISSPPCTHFTHLEGTLATAAPIKNFTTPRATHLDESAGEEGVKWFS
uniref:Ig-like domain-containing protein n=1 Tax=Gallus gallus TaxID=9031 RepID=A0A8V0XT42_CHICK